MEGAVAVRGFSYEDGGEGCDSYQGEFVMRGVVVNLFASRVQVFEDGLLITKAFSSLTSLTLSYSQRESQRGICGGQAAL